MVDVMELDEKRVTYVDVTPDYKALFARFMQCARFDAQDIEKKMDPASLTMVRSLLVNLNMCAASIDSADALKEFQEQLAAMMHNIAVADESIRIDQSYFFDCEDHARHGAYVRVLSQVKDDEDGPRYRVRLGGGSFTWTASAHQLAKTDPR
jgi:hypothetical protein